MHEHLIEHLNAEIVLGTISDYSVALEWLRSTFLYIRVMKNPRHYGVEAGVSRAAVEQRLQGQQPNCDVIAITLHAFALFHLFVDNFICYVLFVLFEQ